MARRAAIDIGTNSVKLLVAETEQAGLGEILFDAQQTTGLGEGISAAGRLGGEAMRRTAEQVEAYAEKARELGAKELRIAGTAALRSTIEANAGEFVDLVRSRTGQAVRILSSEEELVLARIATQLEFGDASPLVVADIGGGSTELTVSVGDEIVEAESYNTGARNMTEAFAEIEPGPADSPAGLQQAVWERFSGFGESSVWLNVRRSRSKLLVAQGGTAYCAARLIAGDEDETQHGRSTSSLALVLLIERVRMMRETELRQLLHFDPDRAPVLLAGLMILDFICGGCYADHFTFSGLSLRHGMLLAETW